MVASAALAQPPADPPPPSTFERVHYKPTGNNGYEELILATEILRDAGNPVDAAMREGTLTLTEKRKALSHPAVRRALELMRQGLRKPIQTVYTKIDPDTVFPQYAGMRALARVLMIEQYVLLADGKVREAINSMADGLLMARAAQVDPALIGGLVGTAINAIVVQRFTDHLDQLSARDCDALLRLTRDWLALPDPYRALMREHRRLDLEQIDRYGQSYDELSKLLGAEADEPDPLVNELASWVLKNPGGLGGLMGQVKQTISAQYDRLDAQYDKPPWQRESPDPPRGSLAARIAYAISPLTERVLDRPLYDRAQMQLLGLHAAIRRYRWEHEELPAKLLDLKVGDMIFDPFSGKPFEYKRDGDRYELSSAGPRDRDDNGELKATRTKFTLPRRRTP